jgi:hypothetical protein
MFETNCFTKTLRFCANFSRKIAKINISDQLTVMWYFLCTPNFRQVLKTHVIKSFILFIKTLLFCANFSWKMIKIVLSNKVMYKHLSVCDNYLQNVCCAHCANTVQKSVKNNVLRAKNRVAHTCFHNVVQNV